MKKSTVALGVIVALGVVGVGGAWFTGEKAQTEYLRQIELANQKIQSLGLSDSVNLVYKNKQFDRSFLPLKWKMKWLFLYQKKDKYLQFHFQPSFITVHFHLIS